MPTGPEGLAWELAVFLAPRAHHSCCPGLPSSLATCLAAVANMVTARACIILWAEARPRHVKVVGWASSLRVRLSSLGRPLSCQLLPLPTTGCWTLGRRRISATGAHSLGEMDLNSPAACFQCWAQGWNL